MDRPAVPGTHGHEAAEALKGKGLPARRMLELKQYVRVHTSPIHIWRACSLLTPTCARAVGDVAGGRGAEGTGGGPLDHK